MFFRDEFDFLPLLEPKQNRSPVVLVDHKLALELWCVKILFQYVYHTLIALRSKEAHQFSGKLKGTFFLNQDILLAVFLCKSMYCANYLV